MANEPDNYCSDPLKPGSLPIKVELNGFVILNTDVAKVTKYMANSPHPGKNRKSGYFGFAGHNDPVKFRNIQIKTLK